MSVLDTVNNVADNFTRLMQMITLLIFGAIGLFFIWGHFAAETAIEEIGERVEAEQKSRKEMTDRYVREMSLAADDWGSEVAVDESNPAFSDDLPTDDWGSN